jgi:hypothetical protein
MAKRSNEPEHLPAVAAEYIELIIRKMRYRRKVRQEVRAELAGHFADALADCKTDQEKQERARELVTGFGDGRLLAKLIRRGKKRCRPLWRTMVARSFQAVGILFGLLVCYCVYISFAQPKIRVNYLDEANRLARPVADENLNAAVLYEKAIEAYVEPPKIKQKVELLDAIGDKKWITDLTDEEVALLEQWVSDNSESLELFRQASERPHCWWQREAEDHILFSVLMPELRPIRDLGKLICWRAKLKANQGQIEWAFDNLLTCYRTGRHLVGPRTLIEQLVGMAMRRLAVGNALTVLSKCKAEKQVLENYCERLRELAGNDIFVVDFRIEKFFYRDIIQRLYTDDGRGSGHMVTGGLREFGSIFVTNFFSEEAMGKVASYGARLGMALVSADRGQIVARFEEAYKRHEAWARMTPWEQRVGGVDEWEHKEFEEISFLEKVRYSLYYQLMPALRQVGERAHRNRAEVEGLMTVMAVLWYHQETQRYPEKLSELVEAGLLKKLPMDPFSDKPLVYRKIDDGFTLYSVGYNFTDDGGMAIRDRKGRAKVWGAVEGDAVFWPID